MRVLRIGAGVVGGALLLLAAFTCGVRWGQGRQSHLYHNGPPVAQGRLGTQVHRLRTETDDVNADADRPPRPPPPRPPPPREAQEHDKDEHIHIEVDSGNESLSLRIIAVFATAGITLLGLAPFFHSAAKALSESVLICIRAGAAGTMLSVAVVHIVPEAEHTFKTLTPYPLPGALMLSGIFLAYCLEVATQEDEKDTTAPCNESTPPRAARAAQAHGTAGHGEAAAAATIERGAAGVNDAPLPLSPHLRGERRGHGGETEEQEREGTQHDRGEAQANGGDDEYDAPQMQQQDRSRAQYDAVQMLEVDEEGRDAEDDIQEMLGSSHRREEGTKAQLHAPHIATAHQTSISVELVSKGITKQACRDVHQQSRHGQPSPLVHHTPSKMTVRNIEVGCVTHGCILGVALGLETSLRKASVIVCVYMMHQLLEALCLSHLIASLHSRKEKLAMVAATTFAMPSGIVMGIVVWSVWRQAGVGVLASYAVACISCLAAGMLVYAALASLIAQDVLVVSRVLSSRASLKCAMCVSFLAGAGCMSALAAGELYLPAGHGH